MAIHVNTELWNFRL